MSADTQTASAYDGAAYNGPAQYALADWRRQVSDLYARLRAEPRPEVAWDHWRDCRTALFRHHPMSPLPEDKRDAYAGPKLFDYDPGMRFCVDLEPHSGDSIRFDLGADGGMTARPVARTAGLATALGAELTVWWIEGYGGGLFIPFTDATSGSRTYGGGRYIVDAIKGADLGLDEGGRLILDFNFAYNPSCALNPAYVCPLAPAGNRLTGEVRAGEQLP